MFSSISFKEFRELMQKGMDMLFNPESEEIQPLIVSNTDPQKENTDDQIKTTHNGD